MSLARTSSNTFAPTQFIAANGEKYAYRRFGTGGGLPLLLLQHFTGTLDNWDPAVTDPLAAGREVISVRERGAGPLQWHRARYRCGHGRARAGFSRRSWGEDLRRAGFFTRRDGCTADGSGPTVDLPQADPRRHCTERRRRHHAPRKAAPIQISGRPIVQRVRRPAKNLL